MSQLTQSENEATALFLKTNGPPESLFVPDIPEHLLVGKSESDRWLYHSVGVHSKQNEWLIGQVSGLKAAHRTILSNSEAATLHFAKLDGDIEALSPCRECAAKTNEHLSKIDATLATFTALRDRWLSRRQVLRNAAIVLATLLLMPFLSGIAVELVKHYLKLGP